ncbi:MAG: flagellar M-ring protein FliF [Inquilinus sp.]|nr:flagellar M-ring protein FliF [Inquilinus sp.]
MDAFSQTLRSLGPARLAAIGAVAIGLIAFFAFVTTRLSTGDMSLLYADLDLTDSGEIVTKLDELALPYQIRGNGGSIMVPADQVARARLLMAQEGLPKGGSLGYEIFDRTEGFGSSSFMQNVNRLRALEGELARTIGTIASVRQARVHLVLPERELFSRDRQDPSASVFLRARGGLSSQQIVAIQHLVAAAVPRLQPQNISIVDDRGTLLARGTNSDAPGLGQSNAEEMRRAYEMRLSQQIEDLLARSVGVGRVRAQVSAVMDFDRVVSTEEIYDPNSQVARSTQLVDEEAESSEGDGLDPVSVAGNLPEADALAPLGGGSSASNRSNRTQETVNFEISRKVLNVEHESGTVERLSVAVLVDGLYETGADGESTYQPRGEEEMAQLDTLVRTAIGYDANRGDTIEVVNMRFAAAEDSAFAEEEGLLMGLTRQDILRIAEMAVMAVVALLVILLVVRPLMARIMDIGQEAPAEAGYDALLPDGAQTHRALVGPIGSDLAPAGGGEAGGAMVSAEEDEEGLDGSIDIARIDGRVRASSVRKIGEIVDKHPEESISIIRNWIYQES